MEKVSGASAYRQLNSLSRKEQVQALIEGIKVLSKLSALGFTHNDLHTDNYFIDKIGNQVVLRLIDFGFARPLFDAEGRPLAWAGTRVNPMRDDINTFVRHFLQDAHGLERSSASVREFRNRIESIKLFETPNYNEFIEILNKAMH
jgi:serine/threonine protein kinase